MNTNKNWWLLRLAELGSGFWIAGDFITHSIQAADVESGITTSPQVSCSHNSGHFPIGTTTVTCTATDAAGNVGSNSFIVTVTEESVVDCSE